MLQRKETRLFRARCIVMKRYSFPRSKTTVTATRLKCSDRFSTKWITVVASVERLVSFTAIKRRVEQSDFYLRAIKKIRLKRKEKIEIVYIA